MRSNTLTTFHISIFKIGSLDINSDQMHILKFQFALLPYCWAGSGGYVNIFLHKKGLWHQTFTMANMDNLLGKQ